MADSHNPNPPSYQDATRLLDWLELAAPFIPAREYARLCLVSRRFYHHFAPRLWNDPLAVATRLSRHWADFERYQHFMLRHLKDVRPVTRSLVTCLDLRRLTRPGSVFSLDSSGPTLTGTLRHLPFTLPRLRCILLDGHSDVDTDVLVTAWASGTLAAPPHFQPPLLLSMAHCRTPLPTAFFGCSFLKSLVYLDVSDVPGSLKTPLMQRMMSPDNLPRLRILKAQGREVDDSEASLLFQTFKDQLWSLDLSRNKLSDNVLYDMYQFTFPAVTLRGRGSSCSDVEGTLLLPQGQGSDFYGPFCFVQESQSSASFTHPQRYLADAPVYTRDAHGPVPQGIAGARLDGRRGIRDDSATSVKNLLCGDSPGSPFHSLDDPVQDLDVCCGHGGITHLYLNENNISAQGIAKLIRSSPGNLHRFECDSMSLSFPDGCLPKWISPTARLSGILGVAHLFRPVFSSNLQVLRIHHSLVTQLPSLETDDLPTMSSLWLAETFLLPRAELAYPEAFLPDMNPRLRSLTLTRIPRYSTGPLIDKLVRFLELVSLQERAIQDAQPTSARHAPTVLLGLRHIRLEFEPDLSEELGPELSDIEGLDSEALMRMTTEEFSFFGDSGGWESSPSTADATDAGTKSLMYVERQSVASASSPRSASEPKNQESARLERYPQPETYLSGLEYLDATGAGIWNGAAFTVPVWVGTGPNVYGHQMEKLDAVGEYMRLLANHPALRANPVPASPCHVAAGVPPGSYIFLAAWDAMLAPPSASNSAKARSHSNGESMRKPTQRELKGMRDVVAAIKAYRVQTRRAYDAARQRASRDGIPLRPLLGDPHFHWGGKLEVSMKDPAAHYHSSKYWR
ncbi:hypothetical protein B0T26DRAFT_790119 [Lasiosphaeria miniovina]|uniref:Leucine rich repeat domain containing protein n=1 Tax=Lasiosphaeria miniovina TaxID=1954250 RepID=A0AA40DMK5_9PEZI|nr:uncharacterized protein B0T26DRAFT_790119 [Lasiosphaeria miniovina]KAK0706761.1 hypothetical protein B0T26DRAFT_790119 [Lasiosphaeria miniovina]